MSEELSLEVAVIEDLNRHIAGLRKKMQDFKVLAQFYNRQGLTEEAEKYYEKAKRAESLLHYLEGAKKEVKQILSSKEAKEE